MIFSTLPFHAFFRCRLLTAYQPTIPHIPIPSLESHHIPSVVFTRVCHPRTCSTDFCCSLLSSSGFSRLCRCLSFDSRRLFSNQSSLPLVSFPREPAAPAIQTTEMSFLFLSFSIRVITSSYFYSPHDIILKFLHSIVVGVIPV